MLKKRQLPSYSDGVVRIFEECATPSSFGAKTNVDTVDDLKPVVRLFFRSCSVREQDYQVSEALGFTCSAKVCTHNYGFVRVGHKAVIRGHLYSISHIDRTATEMYLYLEGGSTFVYARHDS